MSFFQFTLNICKQEENNAKKPWFQQFQNRLSKNYLPSKTAFLQACGVWISV